MRNHETGEFEMVVGNRQLLSGFFVIVLLFAVAFAMGYVVGENSRSAKPQQAEAAGSPPPAKASETRPEPVPVPPPQETPPASKAADSPPAEAPAQPVTQPAREATPPAAPPPSAPSVSASASDAAGDLAPGAYWQVIATANRDSAQAMVQTLRDKGFPATLSPGPNSLTRVLVGPYTDTASMGRAKSELESAGFNRLATFRR
ncbi:MAG TPA: SPOR domain-containing protein [Bryobacteraceae bacterium]|nr:SPOR domain-containing protein [Bryobacteraceae bacterium]